MVPIKIRMQIIQLDKNKPQLSTEDLLLEEFSFFGDEVVRYDPSSVLNSDPLCTLALPLRPTHFIFPMPLNAPKIGTAYGTTQLRNLSP